MTKCSKCTKYTIICIKCKCEKNFCIKCKLPEIHNCNFDYKNNGKRKISEDNPKIINKKIRDI